MIENEVEKIRNREAELRAKIREIDERIRQKGGELRML